MARIYDEQFKRRVAQHLIFCDPLSSEIIEDLMYFLEHPELRDFRIPGVAVVVNGLGKCLDVEPDVALEPVSEWLN